MSQSIGYIVLLRFLKKCIVKEVAIESRTIMSREESLDTVIQFVKRQIILEMHFLLLCFQKLKSLRFESNVVS